ncbi:MAG TPA: OadG family protein, partial [Synergistales bacterium]|nr:OadG family protein [Synergistales bacterium]
MELSHIADKFSHGIGGAIALAMIAFSVVFLVLIALTLIIMGTRYLADLSERKPMKPAGPEQKAVPAPVA